MVAETVRKPCSQQGWATDRLTRLQHINERKGSLKAALSFFHDVIVYVFMVFFKMTVQPLPMLLSLFIVQARMM